MQLPEKLEKRLRRNRLTIPAPISKEMPLGDAVKQFTHFLGIRPCGGCQKRAQTLNRYVTFVPYR